MTRIRIYHSWRNIRGMRIRIAHRRRVAVKPGSSILRLACQGMATKRVALDDQHQRRAQTLL